MSAGLKAVPVYGILCLSEGKIVEEINKTDQTELKGTSFNSAKGSGDMSELDALINETLSENKVAPKEKTQVVDEASFSAHKISSENQLKTEMPKQDPRAVYQSLKHEVKKEEPSAPKEAAPATEKKTDTYSDTFKQYKSGDIIIGTVEKVDQQGALVNINYKSDGFIDAKEFEGRTLKAGDKIHVFIDALSTKEGYVALSLKKAEYEARWHEAYEAFKKRTTIEVKVTSAVAGGLVVDYRGLRAFVPASHVLKPKESQLNDFVGKTLPVKVIEVDKRRSKVIMSNRFGAVEKEKADKEKLLENIEVGQVLKGRVSSVKKFGVFVNLDGVEGLVHINDLSWKRVVDPSSVVSLGQELEVFVLGVDKITKKISLGLKQLQPDPWATAGEKYRVGQTVQAKVLRLAKFGAFAEVEEGIEGLIHISELSTKQVQAPSDAVKPGDIVSAKILRVIPEEQKIGLSIREAELEEEKKKLKEVQASTAPQSVTIGDTISEELKAKLTGENELS